MHMFRTSTNVLMTVVCSSSGVGYPTIHAYITACAYFHKKLGLHATDPTRDASIYEALSRLRDAHATEHVSVLDVLTDLPYIRQAIFSDDKLSEGEKLHWWAYVLVSLEHGCRVSDNTIFCPPLSDVRPT